MSPRGAFDGLPDIIQEIAEVAGLEAALRLAQEHGGLVVLIPRRVGPDHWLVRCLGRPAADKICAHFSVRDADGRPIGNHRLYIPFCGTGALGQAQRRLARELEGGATASEAARRSGLTERTAWRMKARLKRGSTADQGELF